MKPLFRKVPVKLERSFNIRRDVKRAFAGIGHYHPELELHYVIKGEGTRFIGDTSNDFIEGELTLVGANLPHSWQSSPVSNSYIEGIDVVVANFSPEFLGKQFLQLPETLNICKLFDRAAIGLEFSGETQKKVGKLLLSVCEAHGFDRIVLFLQILHLLANTEDCKSIVNGKNMLFNRNESDAKRLNTITEFTLANYRREITLEEVASICNLSVTSFCRYFKAMTRKTYLDFLIEIRVGYACKLLIEDKFPAEAICFDCGFQNISNFYRHFKKVAGITPQEYRKRYILGAARTVSEFSLA